MTFISQVPVTSDGLITTNICSTWGNSIRRTQQQTLVPHGEIPSDGLNNKHLSHMGKFRQTDSTTNICPTWGNSIRRTQQQTFVPHGEIPSDGLITTNICPLRGNSIRQTHNNKHFVPGAEIPPDRLITKKTKTIGHQGEFPSDGLITTKVQPSRGNPITQVHNNNTCTCKGQFHQMGS